MLTATTDQRYLIKYPDCFIQEAAFFRSMHPLLIRLFFSFSGNGAKKSISALC